MEFVLGLAALAMMDDREAEERQIELEEGALDPDELDNGTIACDEGVDDAVD